MIWKFNADVKITTGRSTAFLKCKVVTLLDWFTCLSSEKRINFNSSFWQLPSIKLTRFLAAACLYYLKRSFCNLFLQHSQNKTMPNHKVNFESQRCMDIFNSCSIIHSLRDILTITAFIYWKSIYFTNLFDMIWY